MPFNLGWSEIMMVLVLALVFLGPKKLPELASGLGKLIREIRKTTAGIKDEIQLEEHIRKPLEELREAVTLPADELRRRDDWAKERQRWEKDEQERLAKAAENGEGDGNGQGDGEHQVQGDGEREHDSVTDDSVLHHDHHNDSVDEGEHAPDLAAGQPKQPRSDRTQADGRTLADKTIAQPASSLLSDKTTADKTTADKSIADKTIAMKAPDFGTPRRPTPAPPSAVATGFPRVPSAPAGTVPQTKIAAGPSRPAPALASATPPTPSPLEAKPRNTGTPPPPPPAASRLPPPTAAARKVPAPTADEKKV